MPNKLDAAITSGIVPSPEHLLGTVLTAIDRCPFCNRVDPMLIRVWETGTSGLSRGDGGKRSKWAAYACVSCGSLVTAKGTPGVVDTTKVAQVVAVYPAGREANDLLPPAAKNFLQQAIDVLHAPDAAAVMAGSAVDAMLKASGYEDGSLYARIDKALEDHLLTQGMADWAHSVRLGSNRPRHADKDSPHVSPEDAKRSVDFAEALGNFLFVLSAQIAEAVEQVQPAADTPQ